MTFYELPGSPIRVEAIDMTKGGIDPGVFGYYATMVNQPLAIAKATAATVFAAEDYDPPPVTVEGTPQPALTEHEVSRGKSDARRPVGDHRRRAQRPACGRTPRSSTTTP